MIFHPALYLVEKTLRVQWF